jgi:sugar lactone lactonase YvrE
LKLAAQRGWAIDDEEIIAGVRCCGAPIVDSHGEVRGAISIAGPAFRLTTERLELLGPELAEAARRIGAQLSAARPARSDGEAIVVPGEWAFEGAYAWWVEAPAGARLWWADRLAPALHAASASADETVAGFEHPIQAVLPEDGSVRVLAGDAWHLVGPDGERRGAESARESLPRHGVLAACPGSDGQSWICVTDGERWRVASLDAFGRTTGGWRLNEPATALAWNEAQRTLYLAAADSGTLYAAMDGHSHLRRLATVPKGSGRLGGIAVDPEGGLWTALRGGWSVARFEADGSMDRVVALPVPAPTDVAFGGAAGRTLFVTSARDALDRESLEAAPLSGRLFMVNAA